MCTYMAFINIYYEIKKFNLSNVEDKFPNHRLYYIYICIYIDICLYKCYNLLPQLYRLIKQPLSDIYRMFTNLESQ